MPPLLPNPVSLPYHNRQSIHLPPKQNTPPQPMMTHTHNPPHPNSRLTPTPGSHPPPSPRDRHIAVVHRRSLYVFGGFDGNRCVGAVIDRFISYMRASACLCICVCPSTHTHKTPTHPPTKNTFNKNSRVNDFMEYRVDDREWRPVVALTGSAPTPRHSHTGVVYKDRLYVFSGYDGGWEDASSSCVRVGKKLDKGRSLHM